MNNKLINSDLYTSPAKQTAAMTLVKASDIYFPEAKKKGISILGDVANILEDNSELIDRLTKEIATHIYNKNDYRLIENYEQNCNFFEKYVRPSELKLHELEFKREMEKKGVVLLTEIGIKGSVFAAKKIMRYMDRKKLYHTVWNLCSVYANIITKDNAPTITKMRVNTYMAALSRSLFGKIIPPAKIDSIWDLGKLYLPAEKAQMDNVALILYLIYNQKHAQRDATEQKKYDMQQLAALWQILGYTGNIENMFRSFQCIETMDGFDYGRICATVSGIYEKTKYALGVDTSYANELQSHLADYVPNGDRQRLFRAGTKLAAFTAVTAAGIISENPVLLKASGTMATAALNSTGISDRNITGNVLSELGLEESDIRSCLDEAVKYKKTIALQQSQEK